MGGCVCTLQASRPSNNQNKFSRHFKHTLHATATYAKDATLRDARAMPH